ncbi:hypothetical protein VNO77_02949 [Canavalia gladiata]|uniref:Uncharacterized protein n=1 Tax=Canavalia gladiata TaxID=3824 RepID=A0AAN9MUN6_CANGL
MVGQLRVGHYLFEKLLHVNPPFLEYNFLPFRTNTPHVDAYGPYVRCMGPFHYIAGSKTADLKSWRWLCCFLRVMISIAMVLQYGSSPHVAFLSLDVACMASHALPQLVVFLVFFKSQLLEEISLYWVVNGKTIPRFPRIPYGGSRSFRTMLPSALDETNSPPIPASSTLPGNKRVLHEGEKTMPAAHPKDRDDEFSFCLAPPRLSQATPLQNTPF